MVMAVMAYTVQMAAASLGTIDLNTAPGRHAAAQTLHNASPSTLWHRRRSSLEDAQNNVTNQTDAVDMHCTWKTKARRNPGSGSGALPQPTTSRQILPTTKKLK